MNYLIQRGKVRGQVINVPEGLPEILSDITREVLRCQPTTECLCQFIIDYLHSVIVAREKARVAQAIIERALRIVDEVIANLCICQITREKADVMAATMEECFKRFLEKRRCEVRREQEIIKFEDEDMLDELISRCKFSDDELKISRPAIEEAYNRFVQAYMSATEDVDGTETLYLYLKNREEQRKIEELREQAAISIQSWFRGCITRKRLFAEFSELRGREIEAQKAQARANMVEKLLNRGSGRTSDRNVVIVAPDAQICTPVSAISLDIDKDTQGMEMSAMPITPKSETQEDITEDEPKSVGGEFEVKSQLPPEPELVEAKEPEVVAEPEVAEVTEVAELAQEPEEEPEAPAKQEPEEPNAAEGEAAAEEAPAEE